MTLPLEPTLEELTAEVLSSIGEGGDGVASATRSSMAQWAIRRAQATIINQARWTINRKRASVALAIGATTFDWPDDTSPGRIIQITAVKTDDPQIEWKLDPGITAEDRSLWNTGGFSSSAFVPFKFDFHDGIIEVGPASVAAVTLYLRYELGKAQLVQPSDRPNCDGEAIVRLAEIMLRNRIGGELRGAVAQCQKEFDEYLRSVRLKQGTGETVVLGEVWNVEDPARRGRRLRSQHWMFAGRRPF